MKKLKHTPTLRTMQLMRTHGNIEYYVNTAGTIYKIDRNTQPATCWRLSFDEYKLQEYKDIVALTGSTRPYTIRIDFPCYRWLERHPDPSAFVQQCIYNRMEIERVEDYTYIP